MMITDYYNPKHIDLFSVFLKYKKKITNQPDKQEFEKLTRLLTLESPSLQKYIFII